MTKKNARNTRGKIVNAAWKLFYEQGYEDTTVEEIIELSQTSKGSFYPPVMCSFAENRHNADIIA